MVDTFLSVDNMDGMCRGGPPEGMPLIYKFVHKKPGFTLFRKLSSCKFWHGRVWGYAGGPSSTRERLMI